MEESVSRVGNFPNRIYVSLPSTKEISYLNLISKASDENLSFFSDLEEAVSEEKYSNRIRDLINRAENFGIYAKKYEYRRNSMELETASQNSSVLSSFIDDFSDEEEIGSTQDYQLAVDEGFFTVSPNEIQNNSLKRKREEKSQESPLFPEDLAEKMQIIKNAYNGNKKYTKIPKFISMALKAVNHILSKNPHIDRENILKIIATDMKIGISHIKTHLEVLSLQEKKSEISTKYKNKLKAFKNLVECSCVNGKNWSDQLEKRFQITISSLEEYINICNEHHVKSEGKGVKLEFNVEKQKLLTEISNLGGHRSGNYSQPIEISSESSSVIFSNTVDPEKKKKKNS